jgi:hypothetical protein
MGIFVGCIHFYANDQHNYNHLYSNIDQLLLLNHSPNIRDIHHHCYNNICQVHVFMIYISAPHMSNHLCTLSSLIHINHQTTHPQLFTQLKMCIFPSPLSHLSDIRLRKYPHFCKSMWS